MIATVTLNPAVDKTIKASRLIMGTVNRTDSVTNLAGGKGVNVAKVLRQYDYEVKTLGFVGGYTGDMIADTVHRLGAIEAFTYIRGETRTSINVITEDGFVTELLEPGPKILPSELRRFLNSYEAEIDRCNIVVISGSLPKGVPSTIYADMIRIAKARKKKVLLDTSGDALKKAVDAKPFMIKPNIRELESLMARRINGMQALTLATSQLIERGIPNILVSLGSKGILYARQSNRAKSGMNLYYVAAPHVHVVNTVGSGDCAVAAFAMALQEKLKPGEALRKCVAISSVNAMSLESGVIDIAKAEEMYNKLELSVPVY